MTIVVVIVGALALLAWVVLFVGYPLLQAQGEKLARDSEVERRRQALLFQRDAAYAAIRELETDHRLGNLSREDLHALKEQYTLRAAVVLKELDMLDEAPRGAGQADAEIEEAVARYRRASPRAP